MKDEQLYFNKLANLFRGHEAVGGKLKITNKRLVFKSHSLNIQTGITEIYIEEIIEVKKRNTLGLVPNGMSIIVKDRTEYRFVIWGRNKIIDFIKQNNPQLI